MTLLLTLYYVINCIIELPLLWNCKGSSSTEVIQDIIASTSKWMPPNCTRKRHWVMSWTFIWGPRPVDGLLTKPWLRITAVWCESEVSCLKMLHHNSSFTSEIQDLLLCYKAVPDCHELSGSQLPEWCVGLSGLIRSRLDGEGLWTWQDIRELKAANSLWCPSKCMWNVLYLLSLRGNSDTNNHFLFPTFHTPGWG